MKKYTLYLLTLLACWVSACDTERNTEDPDLNYFVKLYGGDGNQSGVDIEILSDGTFLLLGNWAVNTFESQIFIMRVSSEGEVIWDTRYGAEAERWLAKDMEMTIDGNVIVVADYKKDLSANTDVKVLKFSPDGAVLAEGTFGTMGNEDSRTVTVLDDGGYIISGTTDSTKTFQLAGVTDPDPFDAFNLRIDQNLTRLSKSDWSPVFVGFDNIDVSVKIFQKASNEFYAFGYTNSTLLGESTNPNERKGLFYYRRDGLGFQTNPYYPGNVVNVNDTEISYVQNVGQTFGGGYMVIGTSVNSLGVSDIFFARLRPTLTFSNPLQSDATFYNTIALGRNIRGVSASTSVSGETGFLILGNEVRSTGATNLWLSKIDQSGQVLWSTTLGAETEDDIGAAVRELPDGKIVILGTMGLADNQFKMALIKMNRRGQFLR